MDIICTLFEKHYEYGVGALCNSLVKAEFKGLIIIGYKGDLPFWKDQLINNNDNNYFVNNNIEISFINLNHIKFHFGYYKASFLIECINAQKLTQRIAYFDPDICVDANWAFFKKWIDTGVALVSDNCYPFLHINHPWRRDWIELFKEKTVLSRSECYINSGFIGITPDHINLISLWQEAIDVYRNNGGDITSFERDAKSGLKGDQDLLNAALMFYPYENLSIIGQEGMGFIQPAYVMGHAIYGRKPWKINFIKESILNGRKPSYSEKLFILNANNPIKLFSIILLKVKKFNMYLASLLNRIL